MTNAYKTKSQVREQTGVTTRVGLDSISKAGIAAMGGVSALIGLWAAACLVSAMVGNGGLLTLTRAWLQAVTGM